MGGSSSVAVAGWLYDFQLHTVSPVLGNGWALLGEPDKWVSVSAARFSQLEYDGGSARGVWCGDGWVMWCRLRWW